MDIGLFWSVIRRHARIAILGLVASLVLGFFAVVNVSGDGVERRGSPEYEARTTLLVTQPGFPYGRSTLDEFVPAKGSPDSVPRFSDPSRVQYLAALYAQLAKGDDVRASVRRAVGLPAIPPKDEPKSLKPKYESTAGKAEDGTTLPTVVIAGRATSEAQAILVANAVADGLERMIRQQQTAADIEPDARIVLSPIERADEAKVVKPLRPTRAIMLILLGLIVTVAAIFLIDNVQRRDDATDVEAAGAGVTRLEETDRIGAVEESNGRDADLATRHARTARGRRKRSATIRTAGAQSDDAGAGRRSAAGRADT